MLKDWQRQPSPKRIKHDNATLAEIDFARRDDGCDLTHLLESFNPDELPISCKNFPDIKIDNQSILGAGYWRKTVSGSWNGQRVAVKYVVKEDTCSKRDDCLMRPIMEAAIHQLLQGTGRFLPILGMCGSTLVFPQLSPISKKDFPLSTRTALRYSLEFAQALAHLQESPAGPMSHNDLKLEHMLLDGNGHIRLFDFHWLKYNGVPRRRAGTASDDKRCGHNATAVLAPPEGVAALIPNKVSEALLRDTMQTRGRAGKEQYSKVLRMKWSGNLKTRYANAVHEEGDVYSLGHIVWQLLSQSGELPFSGLHIHERFEGWSTGKLHPPLAGLARAPPEVQAIIQQCWNIPPSKRPRPAAVVSVLQAALDALPANQ